MVWHAPIISVNFPDTVSSLAGSSVMISQYEIIWWSGARIRSRRPVSVSLETSATANCLPLFTSLLPSARQGNFDLPSDRVGFGLAALPEVGVGAFAFYRL